MYTISSATYDGTVVSADIIWFATGSGIRSGTLKYNPTGPTLQLDFSGSIYDTYIGVVSINETTLSFTADSYQFEFTEIPVVTVTNPALWNGSWKLTTTTNTDNFLLPKANDLYTISSATYDGTVVSADIIWFATGSGIRSGTLKYNPTGPTLQLDFSGSIYDTYIGVVSINETTLSFTADSYQFEFTNLSTNIIDDFFESTIPNQFLLKQNYPNPFNPSTKISYSLPQSGFVLLIIYDILGNEIQTLENKFQNAGTYSVNFDASALSSGIYFYKLQVVGYFIETKKMMLLR